MKTLAQAARPLLADFLSTIVFAALTALKVDVMIAASAAAAVGVGQVILLKLRGRPIGALQWLSLVLVVTSGAASLFTHDPRFVMAKPSVVCFVVAFAMLQRGWMLRYMPPIARGRADDLMVVFGYVWAALMALTGVLNLAVAVAFPQHWAAFLAIFPLSAKGALFAIQYLTIRHVVRRRLAAPAGLAAAEA